MTTDDQPSSTAYQPSQQLGAARALRAAASRVPRMESVSALATLSVYHTTHSRSFCLSPREAWHSRWYICDVWYIYFLFVCIENKKMFLLLCRVFHSVKNVFA